MMFSITQAMMDNIADISFRTVISEFFPVNFDFESNFDCQHVHRNPPISNSFLILRGRQDFGELKGNLLFKIISLFKSITHRDFLALHIPSSLK